MKEAEPMNETKCHSGWKVMESKFEKDSSCPALPCQVVSHISKLA